MLRFVSLFGLKFTGFWLCLLVCRIILYAIAMADYDQDDMGVCQNLLKTKDGIDRLALYQSSVGRLILVYSVL